MATIRQTHFLGGELAPHLWGRTDLQIYGAGLRRLLNFFPSRHGPVVSRPGTRLVSLAKYSGGGQQGVRLVPFIYSDEQSYCLEFGHNYLRFHTGGETVQLGGVPYELATLYTAADLPGLNWAQTGDVLTIVHPRHPPRELRRRGPTHTDWTLEDIDFAVPPITFEHHHAYLAGPLPAEDPTHIGRAWSWMATQIWERTDGTRYETAPLTVRWVRESSVQTPVPQSVVVYPDRPVAVGFETGGLLSTAERLVAIRVYRGRGDMFGWVGDVDNSGGAVTNFIDVGDDPDFTLTPPRGRNPFEIIDGYGTVLRTEYPSTVTYFQERRVFGGTVERPGMLFLSATGEYANFDERILALADDALFFELASRKREQVNGLLGLGRLLVTTNASVWAGGGSGGEPLTPTSVDFRVQEEIGSVGLPPLVVGGSILYARSKGQGVRSLSYDANGREGFAGSDLSLHAQHLFQPYRITDWAYAEDPWGLVWAVREDGALLSLTLTGESAGWARHETNGRVQAVCSVPEGNEDAVYLAVSGRGLTKRWCIERMGSRVVVGDGSDVVCLDSALSYAGPPTQVVTGLSHLEGEEVWVVPITFPATEPFGPFTVSGGAIDMGRVITSEFSSLILHIGLPFVAEMETLDAGGGAEKLRQKTVTHVGFEVDQSRGLWVGQDAEHLHEWRQRSVSDSYAAISNATTVVKTPVQGTWEMGARAVLQQRRPLPVTVLGLTREVEGGG